jgi:hypothetical protein
MPVNLTFSFDGEQRGSVMISGLVNGMQGRLKTGLKQAGMLMVRELKQNLKGSNPTTFFFRSPHKELRSRTGALRASINMKMDGLGVSVGPGGSPGVYGAVNEYGATINVTERMRAFLHANGIHLRASTTEMILPPRPWFWPTWEKNKDKAVNLIRKKVMEPVKGK